VHPAGLGDVVDGFGEKGARLQVVEIVLLSGGARETADAIESLAVGLDEGLA
jgi:hypothetical protein